MILPGPPVSTIKSATDGPPQHPSIPSAVAKSASEKKHLRLYTEQPPKPARPAIETVACLPALLRAFQAATGWPLQYNEHGGRGLVALTTSVIDGPVEAPIEPLNTQDRVTSVPSPEFRVPVPASLAVGPAAADRKSARMLAGSIADLLGELIETRGALWRREAELAAGVPITPHRQPEKHLAERLEAVLRAGVQAVDADAAALYLLDEATTELKLRSSWGLPFDRLVAPARPLAGALADLEALLGHAVVLDQHDAPSVWNVPEDFPAAVCLPVSSPTTLLGTLWVFCNRPRDFNPRQTNVLEVVAGRLASDLEREMLLQVGTDGTKWQREIAAAQRRQHNESPTIAPLLDGWDVAGSTAQADSLGGSLHDWFCLPDGLLAVAVGRAEEQGAAGALTAAALRTALRSHARYHRQPEPILQQINLTLWTGSAGDRRASLLLGLIETATGQVRWASAGRPTLIRFGSRGISPRPTDPKRGEMSRLPDGGGWQSLSRPCIGLGESPETAFQQYDCPLQPGEVLLIATDSVCEAADAQRRAFGEAGLAAALQGKLDLSAEELVAAARAALDTHAARGDQDRSILVVKRTEALTQRAGRVD
jgi:serine phosphatase RsbU (regulator of sigma subunit)